MSRTITVHSPAMPSLLGGPAFEFKALSGMESLGNLFRYTIELQTPDSPQLTEVVTANLPIKDLVGKELGVSIALDGRGFMAGIGAGTREINGLVTQARFVRAENRRAIYEVVIEPWLVLATRTSDHKIFQNQTVMEIVRDVLADYPYPVDVRVSQTYPVRVFQVQYGETDFAFLSRLMQEWGIYYFFEHKGEKHTLVLVDDAGAHHPFESAAYQTVNYYGPGVKIDEEYCHHFEASQNLRPGQWVSDDFDFTKPKARLQNTVKMPRNTGHNKEELYRWPGDYFDAQEGRELVRTRMEETGASGHRAQGSGNLRAMVPGCTFTLAKHPQNKSNRDWLIIGVSLSLHEASHAAGQEGYLCHTTFDVQPAADTYRSPQTSPKPLTTGPQTAIVTGPPGQDIYTNEYGQIKVSFHWNRYCSKDQNSSCWIRVSHPWAGSNFGMIATPRIGQEVIVDFENGDPDRPIVTGRVYNALNMPPWDLPANMTQTGIKTRSTLEGAPGAGEKNGPGDTNVLRFEDKKGQEQLWLHAQKDQLTEVENDEDKWVGRDRRKTIDRDEFNTIHRDRTEVVDRNEKINVHGWRTEEVDLDETITIHQNRTETVDLNETVTVHKNQNFNVDLNRTKVVGKNEKDQIGKNWSIKVAKFKTETIGLAYMQNVGLGKMVNIGAAYSLNVGAMMMTNVGLSQSTTVGQDVTIDAGKNIVLQAGECITLKTGKSVLVMKSDGTITVNGQTIAVTAAGDVLVSGKQIHMN